MSKFLYKSKGTNNDTWNVGAVDAESQAAAQKWLDKTFAIKKDESGVQTNSDMIEATFIDQSEFDQLNGERETFVANAVEESKKAEEQKTLEKQL